MLVTERYQEELKLREASPDKVFYDGVNLSGLDPSTIFAPALLLVMADLGIKNPTLGAIQISIFVLAFALGPIFAAPLSEIYGRSIIVRSGFAQNAAQLAVCRFFAGVGGSGGLAVFGGVLADIWDLKERAKASALMSTLLILGPVVGPACGGWISERASWRWTCWVPAMAAAALEIISLIHMKESYIPILLEQKLQRNKRLHPDMDLYTVVELLSDLSTRRAGSFISSAIRPVIYLLVDPVLFLLSLYFAFVFGEVYLLIVTFPDIFGDGYGHSAGFVGIDLLAQGVGNILGLIATVKVHGIIYERQTRPDRRYNPESRLVPAFPGALLIVAGLFLYGFSALKYHFIVLAIQLYIVDCFAFPASAVASSWGFACGGEKAKVEYILNKRYKCKGEMANALITIRQSIQKKRKSAKQQPLQDQY
ncbi:predicted protein [Histoplasma mississippiense (nom. inval.)]|uniref:predicted protein n=1 Tax=Ajellomyces capsulatus (strain NAm1 / WU24) TaxID=2059318 RepID=UPI000157C2F2|nr:predicted protein [Histoplasma mississippiense (nom. inval.)]EDN07889.1 predicted protein [Histoplasma mississippiense (nom. inval.)]